MPVIEVEEESWTPGAETILIEWAEKAAGLRWLHMEASKRAKYMEDLLSMPVVITSTVAGIGSLASNGCGTKLGQVLNYVLIGINLLNAVLVSMQRYLEPGSKAAAHSAIANDYASLYRKISLQLSLPVYRREKCIEFSITCRTEYDRLVSGSLSVPDKVIRKFKQKFASSGQHQPEVVSHGADAITSPVTAVVRQDALQATIDASHPPEDRAALGRSIGPADRRVRRASTVIQDVYAHPGTQITSFHTVAGDRPGLLSPEQARMGLDAIV